jgi:hypothetical protein
MGGSQKRRIKDVWTGAKVAQHIGWDETMCARRQGSTVRDWLAAEDAAVEAAKRAATPPETASPNIIAAPARGPQLVTPQFETVQTPSGPRTRRATQDGFHPVRSADAFDVMALQHKRAGGKGALFTVAQVEAGRAYAALAERCASEGLRCTSPEARVQGQGHHVDWIEGVIARSRRLAQMRAAIGDDVAMEPEWVGGKRRAVRVRALVDGVCIEGKTLGRVLQAHGWHPRGSGVAMLQQELKRALDRLHDATGNL